MNYLKTTYAEIEIRNGILYFTYLPIESFDITIAKQLVADRLKVQGELAYPILCDIRYLNLPDSEARYYLAIEGSILTKAVAYIKCADTDYIAQFFLKVDQPVVPTKICASKEEALEFLKDFK